MPPRKKLPVKQKILSNIKSDNDDDVIIIETETTNQNQKLGKEDLNLMHKNTQNTDEKTVKRKKSELIAQNSANKNEINNSDDKIMNILSEDNGLMICNQINTSDSDDEISVNSISNNFDFYLNNFSNAIETVIDTYSFLFNKFDLETIQKFSNLKSN
jgi:hypothetical protein